VTVKINSPRKTESFDYKHSIYLSKFSPGKARLLMVVFTLVRFFLGSGCLVEFIASLLLSGEIPFQNLSLSPLSLCLVVLLSGNYGMRTGLLEIYVLCSVISSRVVINIGRTKIFLSFISLLVRMLREPLALLILGTIIQQEVLLGRIIFLFIFLTLNTPTQ
jgi:hypothetical protein